MKKRKMSTKYSNLIICRKGLLPSIHWWVSDEKPHRCIHSVLYGRKEVSSKSNISSEFALIATNIFVLSTLGLLWSIEKGLSFRR